MMVVVAGAVDGDPDGARGVSFSFLGMKTLGKDIA